MSGPTPKTRQIVWTRAGSRCEVCGTNLLTAPNSIHHRRRRGMGGNRSVWINQPSNLILICGTGVTGCHGHIESYRTAAYDAGLLLRDGEMPWEHPVQLLQGLVYLTDEGDYATGAP